MQNTIFLTGNGEFGHNVIIRKLTECERVEAALRKGEAGLAVLYVALHTPVHWT